MMWLFLVDEQQVSEVDDFVEQSDIWQQNIVKLVLNIHYRCIMF